MLKSPKKILFITLQGLGDLLLILPCVRAAGKVFPRAEIFVLTLKNNYGLIRREPGIKKIFVYDNNARFGILELLKLFFALRREKFDVSICAYPTGIRSALAGFLSGAGIRIGQDVWTLRKFPFLFTRRIKVDKVKHAVEMNMDLLAELGVDLSKVDRESRIIIDDEQRQIIKEFKRKNNINDDDLLICVHPGAGKWGKSRLWPAEKFKELSDKLMREFKARIIFIGKEEEKPIIDKITADMPKNPVLFLGMPLENTAALLESCDLFIGNNSGPMHIAAASGIPVIGLFGDTEPRIHRPYGDNCIAVSQWLDCSPCYFPHLHGTLSCAPLGQGVVNRVFQCRKGNYECMQQLSVEKVFREAESLLRRLKLI